MADGSAPFLDGWIRGWEIPEPMTVSEWADRYRIIPGAAGAEAGPWRTSRTPYLREIMDCLSVNSPVRNVVFKKSSQVGGTEVLINWILYVLHHAPTSMLTVFPTIEVAKRWSKQRLKTAIDESPALSDILASSKSRDSTNTTLEKSYPGGHLFIGGANSSASLRSMPVQYSAEDEIDEYQTDLNDQGGPSYLIARRQTTYVRRKNMKVSTPTVKGASNIDAAYEDSDRSVLLVPCPFCEHAQRLRMEQLTADGLYCCENCNTLIHEHHKTRMLERHKWVATNPGHPTRGFHINALYSPIGLGDTWQEIAAMRTKAESDQALMKVFKNTVCGESYEADSQKAEPDELTKRKESWQRRTIPRGCLLITIGIDIQHNRWAVLICGWGRGEACWFLDYVEIPGDPTREEDWDALDAVVFAPLINSCGITMRASAIAIDTGNWTHDAYNWVRKNQTKAVIGIKGAASQTAPVVGKPTLQDFNWRGRLVRDGVKLYPVGNRATKDTLFPRLVGDAGQQISARRCHFPEDMPPEFFTQLTSERFDLQERRWLKRTESTRNEAWDCWLYAYAAACIPTIRINVMREPDWLALERILEPTNGDLFALPQSNQQITITGGSAPSPVVQQVARAASSDESKLTIAPPPPPTPPPSPFASDSWSTRW